MNAERAPAPRHKGAAALAHSNAAQVAKLHDEFAARYREFNASPPTYTPPFPEGPQMPTIKETALKLFDACESGKGWDACKPYCTPDATFSAQADALAEIKTLQAYTDWMQGVYTFAPDASYEIKAFSADEQRGAVTGYGIFRGTHTAEGGPVPPTGKSVEAEYVYVMQFEGDKVAHMTKVWNDTHSFKQLGWI